MTGCDYQQRGRREQWCGEHTFRLPRVVDLLQDLHGVWTAAAYFRVPEQETLRFNVPVDKPANRGPEGLLLVGSWVDRFHQVHVDRMRWDKLTDPDQIPETVETRLAMTEMTQPRDAPVGRLDARREGSTDARTRADADAAPVQRRRVGDTGELHAAMSEWSSVETNSTLLP